MQIRNDCKGEALAEGVSISRGHFAVLRHGHGIVWAHLGAQATADAFAKVKNQRRVHLILGRMCLSSQVVSVRLLYSRVAGQECQRIW
jgi:hypothetical protein